MMADLTTKSVAVFARPFTVPGFDETLPAGEYDIETEHFSPPDLRHPEAWKASVLVTLHPRTTHPGLVRTLTVSLADLDNARARDRLTGKDLSDVFLEEMLTDPMVRLVMESDGVSDIQLRHLYSGLRTSESDSDVLDADQARQGPEPQSPIQAAENEGMPPGPESSSLPGARPDARLP